MISVVMLIKHLPASRYLSRIRLIRLDVVERCASHACCKVVSKTALALNARRMRELVEIIILRVA
jgi:hypothetical protein